MALNNIVQLGVVCRLEDFDATVRYWQESVGAGPCWVIDAHPEKQTWYGEPTDATFHTGFAYVGDMQVEVIAPTGDGNSPAAAALAETPNPPRAGIAHHIQLESQEPEASLAELRAGGSTVAWTAEFRGRHIYYLESKGTFGFPYVELTPPKTPESIAFTEAMKQATREWDRETDSIRSYLDFLAEVTSKL